MRKGAILAFALAAAGMLSLHATAQPPDNKGDKDKGPGGKGGFGGKGFGGKGGFQGGGFMGRMQPGQILPVFYQQQLKLTDDQKKAVADLQKDVDNKLDKLFTEEQRTAFKKMKEVGGRNGRGGPGGAGGGFGNGGFGKGRPKVGDKKDD